MRNRTENVDQFMRALDHPLKAAIEAVRDLILQSDGHISEHIKWNAPSFCYKGEDRVTFKLYPQDSLQLVFHRGTKVRDSKDFVFSDSTGLLTWVTNDRAIVTLHGMNDVQARKAELIRVVNKWMEATSD
jgi:hypothetical protein